MVDKRASHVTSFHDGWFNLSAPSQYVLVLLQVLPEEPNPRSPRFTAPSKSASTLHMVVPSTPGAATATSSSAVNSSRGRRMLSWGEVGCVLRGAGCGSLKKIPFYHMRNRLCEVE